MMPKAPPTAAELREWMKALLNDAADGREPGDKEHAKELRKAFKDGRISFK